MGTSAVSELEVLSAKLRHLQTDQRRARSRGDSERILRCQIQIDAITEARDRLASRLSRRGANEVSAAAPQPRAG
jgi:hypothetical protein